MDIKDPNVYTYLAQFADDREVLLMLTANKNFNDDKFFEMVFRRKYPELVIFKKPNQRWKKYYLRTMFFLSGLKEAGLDYRFTPKYSPKQMFDDMIQYDKNFAQMIDWAIVGNLEGIKMMQNLRRIDTNAGIITAIANNHLPIVDYLLRGDAIRLINHYMKRAINLTNNLDILKLIVDRGGNDFEASIQRAKKLGKQHFVDYLTNFL